MSVLLAIKRDLQFSLAVPSRWRELDLSGIQNSKLKKILPTFATISLFCSSIELLARVLKKRRPKNFENKRFFISCASRWFGLDMEASSELWKLRNSVSHQYTLSRKHIARRFGSSAVIEKGPEGFWIFYLHAMYSSLLKASRDICEHVNTQTEEEKKKISKYILKNGFFYVPLPQLLK